MSEAVAKTVKVVKSKSKAGASVGVVADGGGIVKKASRNRKRTKTSIRGYLRLLAVERLHANRTLRSSGVVVLEDVVDVLADIFGRELRACKETLSPGTLTVTVAHVYAMLGVLFPDVVDILGQAGSSGSTIYGDQINAECAVSVHKFTESLAGGQA